METSKPVKQVLIKHKERQNVQDFANMLETIAQKLKTEGKFTFVHGNEQIEVTPATEVEVEYEYIVKGNEHEFEIEFEWKPGEAVGQSAKIE